MHWPPYSPDLNPIENFWPLFKDAVNRHGPFDNIDQLRNAISVAADEMKTPAATAKIRRLVDSMPARLRAVIAAKGAQTKY